MSYKQLFILVVTIWAAELTTRFAFDNVVPQKTQFRTHYLQASEEDGMYYGADLKKLGSDGWHLVSTMPDPDNPKQLICFFEKQSILGGK